MVRTKKLLQKAQEYKIYSILRAILKLKKVSKTNLWLDFLWVLLIKNSNSNQRLIQSYKILCNHSWALYRHRLFILRRRLKELRPSHQCNTKISHSINTEAELIKDKIHPYRITSHTNSIFTKVKLSSPNLSTNNSWIPIRIKTSLFHRLVRANICIIPVTSKSYSRTNPMAKLKSSLTWIKTHKARNNLHRVMSRCILSRIFLVIKVLKSFIQVNSFCNRQSKFKHSNLNHLTMIICPKIYRKRIIRCHPNAYRNRISLCMQHSASILFQKTWVAQHLVQTRQLTRHFEVLLLPVLNSMVSRTWLIKDDSNKVRIILKSHLTLKFKIGLQN